MSKLPCPTEEIEQRAFVQYLDMRGIKFSSIPNSTYTTSWKQKTKNTVTGLRPGLPDLLLVIPSRCLLFVEMKKVKGGVVSEHQKNWIAVLNTVPNVEAIVCHGCEAAIAIVEELLPLPHSTTS